MTAKDEKLDTASGSLKDRFHHAFAVGDEYEEVLAEDEEQILRDIAQRINKRGMTVAAIPFLLLNKPLNMIGANAMQMGEFIFTAGPIEAFLRRFLGPNYTHELLVRTLEKRCSIERLIELLEEITDERPGEESS